MKPRIIQKKPKKINKYTITLNNDDKLVKDEKLERRLNQIWVDFKKLHEVNNFKIWNGKYYRLINIDDVASGATKLEFGLIDYSDVISLTKIRKIEKLYSCLYSNHINTGAMIVTSDDYFIFGCRKNKLHGSVIDIIGGGLQIDELPVTKGENIEDNVFKEVEEEININQDHILSSDMIGIVQSSSSSIIFLFLLQLKISAESVTILFKENNDNEMDKLLFIKKNELDPFIKNQSDYRKLISCLL